MRDRIKVYLHVAYNGINMHIAGTTYNERFYSWEHFFMTNKLNMPRVQLIVTTPSMGTGFGYVEIPDFLKRKFPKTFQRKGYLSGIAVSIKALDSMIILANNGRRTMRTLVRPINGVNYFGIYFV